MNTSEVECVWGLCCRGLLATPTMAENGPFGTSFLTPKIPLQEFMWFPFLYPFPGNEAHKPFSEGPKSGVSGVGQKVYVEKVYMCFSFP